MVKLIVLVILHQPSGLYLFHFRDVTDEGSIVNKVIQLPQLAEVLHVILPNDLKKNLNNYNIQRSKVTKQLTKQT